MKRYGNLYERICSIDNLREAFENASIGKRNRSDVLEYGKNLEANLEELRRELLSHTYKTSDYHIFTLYEPKERIIYKLPFRDRVVHWAIMLLIEPIWTRNFTRDTYACVKGRGIHPLLNKLRRDLQDDPEGTAYCLKLDVRKFYPSINHEILKEVIRQKIKDPELLWLLDGIIDSADTGVPIGNYLSQFFANLYLSELDHLLKESYGVRYYYRYADDIVLLADNKEKLHGWLVAINDYLNDYRRLSIKKNYQVYPVESRGVDFIGYVSYHTHVLARKKNKKALCRKVARLRKRGLPDDEIRLQVASEMGFMSHCNSNNLLKILGMKKFSEIRKGQGKLDGEKLHIEAIVGKVIQLTAYDISNSKYRGELLTIQYILKEDIQLPDGTVAKAGEKHISFTGSEALAKVFKETELEDYPCEAKIIKQNFGDRGNSFYTVVDPDD
ncbi:RNA-dependent DNA polymerase [Parabacteroides faecis]|uniref:RNA-directed DNA polymerase n=1 Tax=Parabacteroides TaxID=375288 RepID=UPI000EFEF53A|nr:MULTISPECIES: RNA-directed DNA polymerase [Parabacteroides]MBC8620766.1 RNA-dependent DNA polymerase [Parabacteroides faecis]RHR92755.1 RNA-dependent DNA polymerase [Parabacteroides sp. AF14-59]